MAHPFLEQLQQLLQDVGIDNSDIVCKHFFSGAAAYTNGHIFSSLTPKGLAFKLAQARCEALFASSVAVPLRYFDQSPVKRGYALFSEHQKFGKNTLKKYFLEAISTTKQDIS